MKKLEELQNYLLSLPQTITAGECYGLSDVIITTRFWSFGDDFFDPRDYKKRETVFHIDDLIPTHIGMVVGEIDKHRNLGLLCLCRRVSFYIYPNKLYTRLQFGRVTDIQSAYLKLYGFKCEIPDDVNFLINEINNYEHDSSVDF